MTGIAWGDYQDYQDGRYDGRRHDDEIQTQKNGEDTLADQPPGDISAGV